MKTHTIAEKLPQHNTNVYVLNSLDGGLFKPYNVAVSWVWQHDLTGDIMPYIENDTINIFATDYSIRVQFNGKFVPNETQWFETNEHSIQWFLDKSDELFNKLCFYYDGSIVRCIGRASDEFDYYYITRKMNGELMCISALVPPIVADFGENQDHIEDIYAKNGCPKEDCMLIENYDV